MQLLETCQSTFNLQRKHWRD